MDQQAGVARVVGLEAAMAIARELHQAARLAEAEAVYRKILAAAPDHPEALHCSGILAHQQDRDDEAVSLIERSVALEPGRADWHNNLGIVLKALGRLDDAAAAYRRAIALDADHANAHSNLGNLLCAQGRPAEAEAAYRRAIELNPDHIGAYENLGRLLDRLGRSEEALECFCRVTTLSPMYPSSRHVLATMHWLLGRREQAADILEQWLRDEPGNPVAAHMLAGCTGRGVPARASDGFVEIVYDSFASTFEAKLQRLKYRAPAIVGAMLADAGLAPAKDLDVLDAGCGTGLCGSHLAPYSRRLTGVDLSAGMLAEAAEKTVYDDLVKAELTAYLSDHPASFDLIVSADTLCYFGRLEEVAIAARAALRPRGLLVVTVEEWLGAGAAAEFVLRPHGRYAHARGYVERVLAGAGLEAVIARVELRMEAGTPVAGLAVRGVRPVAGTTGGSHA